MKHYGDITKLSGYELPVVDVAACSWNRSAL